MVVKRCRKATCFKQAENQGYQRRNGPDEMVVRLNPRSMRINFDNRAKIDPVSGRDKMNQKREADSTP